MADSREVLTIRLTQQLGMLVGSVEIAIRNNLSSSNVVAETTLAGLLNKVYGWELVNANAISQNFPGVDLIDKGRSIAVQVTSSRTTKKVRHTLEEVAKLDTTFDRLILLVITNHPATPDMTACAGAMEIWNIPDVLRAAKELETEILREITDFMDKELGFTRAALEELPHLELPLIRSRLQVSGFVGRQNELDEIRKRFEEGDKLVVLTGLGGMGKTELAVRYGLGHSGTVYFARFDGSFTRTLSNMAQGIRPALSEEQLRQDEGALSAMVLKLLKESGSQDLLIIDNADSPTGDLDALQEDDGYQALYRLPLRLLVTTRSDAPRAIQVEPMPDASLMEIFRKHGTQLSEQEMTKLIRAVNGHTLTIDLIARTLNSKGLRKVTAEMMLKALRENTLSIEKYRKIATDYNQSTDQAQIYQHLSTVFDMSPMSDDEKALLGTATLFPENGIDGDLIADIVTEEHAEIYEALIGRGWLEKNGDLVAIHPVIRLVCRTEIPPTDEGCVDFLNGLTEQYDENNYQKDRYRQMAEVLDNASRFLEDTVGSLAAWAGMLWRALGDFVRALDRDLLAIKKCEENLPPDDPSLATSCNNVGLTYGHLGNHKKALEYLRKALDIQEKVLPQDHPHLATSYNNVGLTYSHLGDHKKALEYQRKALDIREKAYSQDHPDLATSYNNVGGTYVSLGNHKKALEYLLKTLTIREKVLPTNHPRLAISYDNVGCAYGYLGNHRKAMEYHQKALDIREKVLPPDHPDLARTCSNIAWIYHNMGQLQDAAEYMRRAADIITRSSLPENHPDRMNYPKWADRFEKEAKMQQTMMEQMQKWGMDPFGIRLK